MSQIKSHLNNYFDTNFSDINDRRIRAWYKIERQMRSENPALQKALVSGLFGQFGTAPLIVALILIILGGGAISAFSSLVPGDKFYSVKRAAEKVQLSLVTDEQKKEQVKLQIVETRVSEVTRLEEKIQSEGETAVSKDAIAQIKIEMGKTALQLITPPKEDKKVAVSEKGTSGLVEIAVAEAVTKFLRSTELTGKQKIEALKQVALKAKEEVEEEQKAPSEPVKEVSEPKKEPASEEPSEPVEEPKPETTEPKPGSIQGEVESNIEVQ